MNTNTAKRTFSARNGLTLIELLVVIAIIAILASLLLPTLGKAKSKVQSVLCGQNLKKIQLAWQIYADDNNGLIVTNYDVQVSGHWEAVSGWVRGNAQYDLSDDNLRKGLLWPHLQAPKIYKCPTDRSTVQGMPNLLRFRSYQSERSLAWGYDGPSDRLAAGNLRKDSDALNPALSMGFLDVSEKSIDTASFRLGFEIGEFPQLYWYNMPGQRHSRGGNFSFIDGHAQYRRWRYTRRDRSVVRTPTWNDQDNRDAGWILNRTHIGQWRTMRMGFSPAAE